MNTGMSISTSISNNVDVIMTDKTVIATNYNDL
jgi:hypothetical protein